MFDVDDCPLYLRFQGSIHLFLVTFVTLVTLDTQMCRGERKTNIPRHLFWHEQAHELRLLIIYSRVITAYAHKPGHE